MQKKLANAAVIAGAIGATLLALQQNTTLFSGSKAFNASERERCYGISKAGANSCGNRKHSCAGRATVDWQPDEWKMVSKGTCEKMGGHLKPQDAEA